MRLLILPYQLLCLIDKFLDLRYEFMLFCLLLEVGYQGAYHTVGCCLLLRLLREHYHIGQFVQLLAVAWGLVKTQGQRMGSSFDRALGKLRIHA